MLSDAQRERLAARLRQGRAAAAPAGIPRRSGAEPAPASFGQEQLWFVDRFAPGQANYNIAGGLRLRGTLDIPALNRAFAALAERHESLRTRLVAGPDGRPVQLVDVPSPAELPFTDLSELDPSERQHRLTGLAGREAAEPFDLATGPLFRCRLVRLSEPEQVLLMVLHHTIFDGWSFGVLLTELPALYEAELSNRPSPLPALPIQFGDYAVWERERLVGATFERLVSYWRQQLAEPPVVQLATDWPRPVLESHRGAVAELALAPELVEGLRALAVAENTTLYVVLLTAWAALLARYTGQSDLIVGTPSANRSRRELAPLIGFLVNTLPIRVDFAGDPAFTTLLQRVHDTNIAAYAHQDIPFAQLVDVLQVERDPSRTPLFQIMFSHAETGPETVHRGGLDIDVFDGFPHPDNAKFDLAVFVGTNPDRSEVRLQYATDLFAPDTADRLLAHYATLLAGVVAEPSSRLAELPLLSDAELYNELIGWNSTELAQPEANLCQLLAEQASRTPDAVAVLAADRSLSYAALATEAGRVTAGLVERGVRPGALVGIAMAPAAERFAVVLGVLGAGAGYVPLDPTLPAERLGFMAADAGLELIVADDAAQCALPDLAVDTVGLAELAAGPSMDPIEFDPSAIAYLIYTSGSTGRPKGVLVEHRQVTNFARGLVAQWRLGVQDRVLQYSSLNFDVSVLDIFGALLSGATAVVADQPTRLSPPRLAELIRSRGVTVAALTPAVLSLLTDADLPSLRLVISCGDELTGELTQAWQRPGLELVNAYGPTETTVLSTFAPADGRVLPPPIGLPLPNYRNYVLDAELNPVPLGVVGELYIGGAGVARGYLNRPELTAERFLEDPYVDGARMYRSGDLVRRRPDGQLCFAGRADGQIKLRGLRIELGEIERAMSAALSRWRDEQASAADRTDGTAAGVELAAAVVRDNPVSGREIVGYYRSDCSPGELRARLADWLPAYMIPARLVPVTGFSLNSSGKIDKKSLPDPYAGDEPVEYQAPAGPTETALAAVFATVLRQDRISVGTSFFDAGGNSLQAMQLVSAVQAELGVDIGVNEIFLAPSARALAGRLDGRPRTAAAERVLVELTATAAEAPLVLVHAVGGTVFSYAALAAELSGRYRVYGLQSPALIGQNRAVDGLTELAASYLVELRSVQPHGPYRLGGWSFGGLLAHAMAVALEGQGETVELLILLDAPFQLPEDHSSRLELARYFVTDSLRTIGGPDVPSSVCSDGDEQNAVLAELDRLARLLDPNAPAAGAGSVRAEVGRRFEAFTGHRRLMSGYRPDTPVQARTLVIGAVDSGNVDAQPSWLDLLPKAERHSFAADHYTLLNPDTARAIAQLVEKAQIDADAAS